MDNVVQFIPKDRKEQPDMDKVLDEIVTNPKWAGPLICQGDLRNAIEAMTNILPKMTTTQLLDVSSGIMPMLVKLSQDIVAELQNRTLANNIYD